MKAAHDEALPVAYFAFSMVEGEKVIHQLWITPMGKEEWRPVPMIEMSEKKPSVAGFLPEDDD